MLHTNAFAGVGIGPSGDIACRENIGITGLQARIDQDAAIETQASRLCQLKTRLNANAHHHDVRVDLVVPLQERLLAFNPSDLRAEVQAHAFCRVSGQNEVG